MSSPARRGECSGATIVLIEDEPSEPPAHKAYSSRAIGNSLALTLSDLRTRRDA